MLHFLGNQPENLVNKNAVDYLHLKQNKDELFCFASKNNKNKNTNTHSSTTKNNEANEKSKRERDYEDAEAAKDVEGGDTCGACIGGFGVR